MGSRASRILFSGCFKLDGPRPMLLDLVQITCLSCLNVQVCKRRRRKVAAARLQNLPDSSSFTSFQKTAGKTFEHQTLEGSRALLCPRPEIAQLAGGRPLVKQLFERLICETRPVCCSAKRSPLRQACIIAFLLHLEASGPDYAGFLFAGQYLLSGLTRY